MKMDNDERSNAVIFSTGRKERVSQRVIGIGDNLDTYSGYDEYFYAPSWRNDEEFDTVLTPAEQIELADYMIDLWTKFKARAIDGR